MIVKWRLKQLIKKRLKQEQKYFVGYLTTYLSNPGRSYVTHERLESSMEEIAQYKKYLEALK